MLAIGFWNSSLFSVLRIILIPVALVALVIFLHGLVALYFWTKWAVFGVRPPYCGDPSYCVTEELASCWWLPLQGQGFEIGQPEHGSINGISFVGRTVRYGRSELLVEVGATFRPVEGFKQRASVGLNRIGDHHEYLHRAIGQIMLASGGKKYISPFDLELCLAFPTAPELLAILEALKGLNGIQVEPRELPEGCGPKRLRVWPDGHPRHGLRLDLGLAIEPCQQLLIPYTVLSWRRGFLGRAQEPSRRFAEEVAQGLVGAGGQRIETTIQRPAHWPQVDLPERSPVP